MPIQIKAVCCGEIQENAYLVCAEGRDDCVLIDPGDDYLKLKRAVGGRRLAAILLTHGHFDHFLAAEPLRNTYQIPVYIHKGDAQMEQPAGMPKPNPTHFYDEGDVIRVGELEFHVLHTPGHSEGSVTLKCGNTLFTGDTLFKNSMGRTDFPGGSDAKIFASLIRLAELPGDYEVCPGHEDFSTLEEERKNNYCIHYAFNHR